MVEQTATIISAVQPTFTGLTYEQRVQAILAVVGQFVADLNGSPIEPLPDTSLSELGIDSLQAVDLVFRFEEKFGVSISMSDFDAKTVTDAVAFMNSVLEQQAGTASR
jgi:acyl carrier protein